MNKALGPWTISGVRQRLAGMPVLSIYGPDDKVNIFVLYGDGSAEQHKQAYREAHMIVAAPNMLGQHVADMTHLRSLLTAVEKDANKTDLRVLINGMVDDKAKVIAKAEGYPQ